MSELQRNFRSLKNPVKMAVFGYFWRQRRRFGVDSGVPLTHEIGPVKIYSPSKPDGRWQVTWSPPGLRRKVSARNSEAEALEFAKKIRTEFKKGRLGRVHRVTVQEQEWITLCRQLDDPTAFLKAAIEQQVAFAQRITVAECCDRYVAQYQSTDRTSTRKDVQSRASIIRKTLGGPVPRLPRSPGHSRMARQLAHRIAPASKQHPFRIYAESSRGPRSGASSLMAITRLRESPISRCRRQSPPFGSLTF